MSRVVFGAILGLSKIAKPVSVMLQSGLAKQLLEADILLFIEAERVFITRCFRLLSSFLVGIHSFRLKGVRLGRTSRPCRARCTFVRQTAFCRTKVHLAVVWRQQKSAPKNCCRKFRKSSLTGPEAGSVPGAILRPSGAETSPRCGLERS